VEVEKITDSVVAFRLKSRYPQFLNNLTIGVLPQHLWVDVRPINFPLSELNLKPVGSGPFKFSSLKKDKQGQMLAYELKAHEDYHGGRPYLDGIVFQFYGSEQELVDAFNDNDIQSIGYVSAKTTESIKFGRRLTLERLKLPRYFALFLNQNQSEVLSDKNARLALAHATNRVAIINEVLDGNAFLVDSPLLGGVLDINPNVTSYEYDPELARQILKSAGYTPDDDGVPARRGKRLEITLVTSTWHELAQTAELIAQQWREIGAQVTVETLPVNQLNRDVISPRAYQVLLFGQVLNFDPDPYTLWHSSQFKPPGGNLSLYANQTADKLMDEARQTANPIERAEKYDEFQKVLIDDIPAIFLYSPYYLYGRPNQLEGFDTTIISLPSDRFTNAASWYVETTRTFRDTKNTLVENEQQ
jgi:peptide/nickel transport system substrate-binding protein